jgi:hypothetical protein
VARAPRPPKPPFDPVWGAWIVLLLLVGAVLLQQVLVFVGCLLGVQPMCTRRGENLSAVALEVLTAIAVLISARRQ